MRRITASGNTRSDLTGEPSGSDVNSRVDAGRRNEGPATGSDHPHHHYYNALSRYRCNALTNRVGADRTNLQRAMRPISLRWIGDENRRPGYGVEEEYPVL